FADFFDRTGRRETSSGAGDEDVDVSELPLDRDTRCFDLAHLHDVGLNLDGASAGALDLRMHVREGCSIAAMHRYRRAALREELRDGRSDTARAAGDPCHFPVQRFHAGTRAVRNTIGSVDSRPAPMATPIAINAICVGGLTVIRKTTPVRRNVLTVREAA